MLITVRLADVASAPQTQSDDGLLEIGWRCTTDWLEESGFTCISRHQGFLEQISRAVIR